jgi:hypothetical protein
VQSLVPPPPPIRTVEVVPPSARGEGTWVFLTIAFVVLCVIYIVAFERNDGAQSAAAGRQSRSTLPYQVLFRDLPSAEQRVFRQMQEGVVEAMARRASTGSWPSVETLAAQGIPPFAPDVLDKAQLRWSLRRAGLLLQYLGVPSASGAALAYLIYIQEPDPETGEKAKPSVVDEEHQLLPDGTLLHVTYWKRAGASALPGVITEPALDGWLQIRVTSLIEELEKQS